LVGKNDTKLINFRLAVVCLMTTAEPSYISMADTIILKL